MEEAAKKRKKEDEAAAVAKVAAENMEELESKRPAKKARATPTKGRAP